MPFYQELFQLLKEKQLTKEQLAKAKMRLAKKHHLNKIPTDIDILLHTDGTQLFEGILLTKPIRSISGVTPIAIMTKPYPCPHGRCTFCPGGPGSVFGDVPQSYTGKEPATMRALRAGFDSYLQVFNRLEQYVVTGHVPQKCEVIVMGGTFPAMPREYLEHFIASAYKAMNDFSALFFHDKSFDFVRFKEFFLLPGDVRDAQRTMQIQEKMRAICSEIISLKEEQERNENSNIKCIGLTVETKPDFASADIGKWLLTLGCTRIELGVQSVYDSALALTNRGHTVADSIKAIHELRDLGFKLNFHYMLGLPGVSKEMEKHGLMELFTNSDFRPDMLKLYPCMVLRGTPLYSLWKDGRYAPTTTKEAAECIAGFKQHVPEYCRIMRVQRDIPTNRTEAGVDRTNLRQYIENVLAENGIACRCIRCREVGHIKKKHGRTPEEAEIVVRNYEASNGVEIFISMEDKRQDILLGFCRLRFPSQSLSEEITPNSAIIRELHVYGHATLLGEEGEFQHKGCGKALLAKAEDIAAMHGKNKIIIISGIGVRGYYKKLGYGREGPYMVKILRNN